MNKKKWALLVIFCIFTFGYYKLLYKTYSEKVVAKSADNIIAIDVKRITNTILWSIIKHPSKWKTPSISKTNTDIIDWKDIIEIPDYIFAFHAKAQPQNAWYTVLKIKEESLFLKGIQQYNFEKLDSNSFVNKENGIQILKNANKILISTTIESAFVNNVANELFNQQSFALRNDLDKVIAAKSHIALKLAANTFLQEDAIATINFDEENVEIKSNLLPKDIYPFSENAFSLSTKNLLSFGFTQPSPNILLLLSDSNKVNITKAINISIDSLLLPSNKYYMLNIPDIKTRVDSAISYTYDDDFNKIEKVVVNNIDEPMLNFKIAGDSVNSIYNNWVASKKIEITEKGNLFTPIPFVKCYCQVLDKNILSVKSNNYISSTPNIKKSYIFFIRIVASKIPNRLLKYLPNNAVSIVEKIETFNLSAIKNKNKITINGSAKIKGSLF